MSSARSSAGTDRELVLLPSLQARVGERGGFVLTQKYLNGARAYAKSWPGPVTSLVRLASDVTTDMDHVEAQSGEWGTGIEPRPAERKQLAARLRGAGAVLAHLSRIEAPLADLCREIRVPLVYGTEYSLATEEQIIDAETQNPLLRWRRKLWVRRTEKRRIDALSRAAGVQCSGTPTYEVYRHYNPRALLFFDNRVEVEAVVGTAELESKLDRLQSQRPLRLVFGGRLVAMKGVLDLVGLAERLMERGLDFEFEVFGRGPLEGELQRAAAAKKLGPRFRLRGALEFETGWIPMLKREQDLFVCCHPQGDPSSTYPEVMSCGVPIAGYDNEAFRGIVERSGSGWLVPIHDIDALAAKIVQLDRDRAAIARAARLAREFALAHAFQPTYARRVQHLVECATADARP